MPVIREHGLITESAKLSVTGHREDNQDRVAIVRGDRSILLVVADGMGGHQHGALAAETAIASLQRSFEEQPQPLFDPQGFLHLALGRAHVEVANLGQGLPFEARPRATCAVCLVQGGSAYWTHVGDSRAYHLRSGAVLTRTRDHSHVERLLRDRLITPGEARHHPMRNFVESCLGGDRALTEMTVGGRRSLSSGDLLLVCSDGVWASFEDDELAAACFDSEDLAAMLDLIVSRAVDLVAPHSDNATAAVLRWIA